jgi:hypothetical protein
MMFRNDDVSFDTNIENFSKFCKMFSDYGFVQTHALTLYGRTGSAFEGGASYAGFVPTKEVGNDKIVSLAKSEAISSNQPLVEFLRSRWQDELALHGLYHYDYAKVSNPQVDIDISLGIMRNLFPDRKVNRFVAPFNSVGGAFIESCRDAGLIPTGATGIHLEEALVEGLRSLNFFETYRYHHHRFYLDSKFTYYRLSMGLMRDCLAKDTSLFLPSPVESGKLGFMCKEQGVESWHVYSNANIYEGARRIISVLANASKESRVFEIGAGIGLNLLRLMALGFKNVSGIDLDVKAVRVGNQLLGGGLQVDDANTVHLPENTDIVILFNTGEIIPGFSYPRFIDRCSAGLNDGGLLVMNSVWPGAISSATGLEYATVIDPKILVEKARSSFDLVYYLREQELCVKDWYVFRKRGTR